MPISIVCSCGKRLRVADEMTGKKVRCPGCKNLLVAKETAPPASPPPSRPTRTKPAPPPASKASPAKSAAAERPKARKSSGKVFWLVGCGCLGLLGTGVAAVAAIIIIAVASHKSYKDKLVGEWVLDSAESRRLSMDVPASYKDIRYKFDKDGTCNLHCQKADVPKTWQVTSEKSGNGPATVEMVLNTPAGDSPMPCKIHFWNDDKIEITFPINCMMRRGTAADPAPEPGGGQPVSPPDPGPQPTEHERPGASPHRQLSGHATAIRALAFSKDSHTLASCSQDSARLWDLDRKTKGRSLRTGAENIYGVAFVGDGQTLVTAGGKPLESGTFRQWDVATGREKGVLRKSKWTASEGLAVTADGKLLAWDEAPMLLWDVERGAARGKPFGQAGAMYGLYFSPDGKRLAGFEKLIGSVQIWDVERPTAPPSSHRLAKPTCLAWSPDSAVLAIGSENKTVTLWEPATKKVRKVIPGLAGAARGVAMSPDGKVLAVSCQDAVHLYDPTSGRELATWKSAGHQPHVPGCLVFSPDGKKLASGSADFLGAGTIVLLDVEALLKPQS
jgi:WD40 repeat protein